METRPFFVFGDLFANVLVASAATLCCAKLIGGTWGMLPGMVAGMLLGMLIALVLVILLVPVLGIMETMMPCMLAGMFGGMCGGMWALSSADALRWGVGIGVAAMLLIYLLNYALSGPQKVDT
jgi:hypothetical protein